MLSKERNKDVTIRLTQDQRRILSEQYVPEDDPIQAKLRFALTDGDRLIVRLNPAELTSIYGSIVLSLPTMRGKKTIRNMSDLADRIMTDHSEILVDAFQQAVAKGGFDSIESLLNEVYLDESEDAGEVRELMNALVDKDLPFSPGVVVALLGAAFPGLDVLEKPAVQCPELAGLPPQFLYLDLSINDPKIEELPFVQAMDLFLNMLLKAGPQKLNKDGGLPQRFLRPYIEAFPWNHWDYQQDDCDNNPIEETYYRWPFTARIIAEAASWTKRRKSELSITNAGKKFLTAMPPGVKLAFLFRGMFGGTMNTAYFDDLPELDIIQTSIPYSIAILSRMKNNWMPILKNARSLLLPDLNDEIKNIGDPTLEISIVSRLLFPLAALGLVEVQEDKLATPGTASFRKTPLFDEFIHFIEGPPLTIPF